MISIRNGEADSARTMPEIILIFYECNALKSSEGQYQLRMHSIQTALKFRKSIFHKYQCNPTQFRESHSGRAFAAKRF
jgi:hypothetical protein